MTGAEKLCHLLLFSLQLCVCLVWLCVSMMLSDGEFLWFNCHNITGRDVHENYQSVFQNEGRRTRRAATATRHDATRDELSKVQVTQEGLMHSSLHLNIPHLKLAKLASLLL